MLLRATTARSWIGGSRVSHHDLPNCIIIDRGLDGTIKKDGLIQLLCLTKQFQGVLWHTKKQFIAQLTTACVWPFKKTKHRAEIIGHQHKPFSEHCGRWWRVYPRINTIESRRTIQLFYLLHGLNGTIKYQYCDCKQMFVIKKENDFLSGIAAGTERTCSHTRIPDGKYWFKKLILHEPFITISSDTTDVGRWIKSYLSFNNAYLFSSIEDTHRKELFYVFNSRIWIIEIARDIRWNKAKDI